MRSHLTWESGLKAQLEPEDIQLIAERVSALIKPMLSSAGTHEDDVLLTTDELAEYLKVKKQWIYDQVHNKRIPFLKVSKFTRFRKSEIDKWLETREQSRGRKLTNPVRRLLEPTPSAARKT